MHDTAYEIGQKFFELYTRPEHTQIVELGSANINGSLRDHNTAGISYLGLDVSKGKGVDVIVAAGEPLPLASNYADIFLASSVFEHDPCFWVTFLELCRVVKPGGLIYINAPSNGFIHRYPGDFWRFYPDASRALTSWAVRNGYELSLIESFTAERRKDVWNDFVSVFQKAPAEERADSACLFNWFPCRNILKGNTDKLRQFEKLAEDQRLLQAARTDLREREVTHNSLITELAVRCANAEKLYEQVRSENEALMQSIAAYDSACAQLKTALDQIVSHIPSQLKYSVTKNA